ncbi:DUF3040 domain-containing protein [Amycolatopsis sp. cmx-4-61]|uniref:DUF3040 domain-containing protein n=1 Tax=Amycolatopsis sp. cmx-4-61 TaxID=2790937 RepID=UPI00397D3F40
MERLSHEARSLRAIERGLLATDAAWMREVFGDVARPKRRSWLVLCAVLDVLALGLIVLGVVAVLPLAFAGFVLMNVAACAHLERARR